VPPNIHADFQRKTAENTYRISVLFWMLAPKSPLPGCNTDCFAPCAFGNGIGKKDSKRLEKRV
jgi:glutamate dehydrogenase/leucine dehydrogenase